MYTSDDQAEELSPAVNGKHIYACLPISYIVL